MARPSLHSLTFISTADNLKAVYQRALAHAALCNEDEAHRDFNRVLQLDPKFKPIVKQEIKKMSQNIRVKCINEKKKLPDKHSGKVGKEGAGQERKENEERSDMGR